MPRLLQLVFGHSPPITPPRTPSPAGTGRAREASAHDAALTAGTPVNAPRPRRDGSPGSGPTGSVDAPPAYRPPAPGSAAAETERTGADALGQRAHQLDRAGMRERRPELAGMDASRLLQAASGQVHPLTGTAARQATAHALATAVGHLPETTPGDLDAVDAAIVPLRRAVAVVDALLPAPMTDRQRHAVRKALMRAMDPVARLLPRLHAGQRAMGPCSPRDPGVNEVFADWLMQYGGRAPFPTRFQLRLLAHEAVARTDAPDALRPALRRLLMGNPPEPWSDRTRHRGARLHIAYRGASHRFDAAWLPSGRVARQVALPAPGSHLDAARLRDLLGPATAHLTALVDEAAAMPPPDGAALAAAVGRALGRQRIDPATLAARLAEAVAPESPRDMLARAVAAMPGLARRLEPVPAIASADEPEQLPAYRP